MKKVIGFDQELVDAIDGWRGSRLPVVNFSEAVRTILAEQLRSTSTQTDDQPASSAEAKRERRQLHRQGSTE